MKKTIIAIALLVSINCYSQKQVKDTLEITTAKYIKVDGKLIAASTLKDAVLILDEKTIKIFIDGLQDLPAKCANPVVEYFLKFFGFKK